MAYRKKVFDLLDNDPQSNVETIVHHIGCSARTARRYRAEYLNKRDEGRVQKAVLLPDIHYPHVDWPTWWAAMEFMEDYKPDVVIYQGDSLEMDCISTWNTKKPLLNEGKRLHKDYADFDADILSMVEMSNPNAEMVFIIGNHEQRVNWYLQKHPELQGLIEPEICLNLEKRGYTVVPFNGVYKLGKLSIIHGYYWNIYHAAKTVNVFERSVAYAHVHNPQSYSKLNPVDADRNHMAWAMPCMCTVKPSYQQNAPNRWVSGFGVVETLPNRYFNVYPIIVSKGKFAWNGKMYGR
jgi:hypothetical protein